LLKSWPASLACRSPRSIRSWSDGLAHAEVVRIEKKADWVPQDPDDDKFIETALVGGAAIIVSGDHHLLALGKVQGIEILTARQFLDRLAVADLEL